MLSVKDGSIYGNRGALEDEGSFNNKVLKTQDEYAYSSQIRKNSITDF